MRIREIIYEDLDTGVDTSAGMSAIEDEADTRGDSALVTSLEWLRNEAEETSAVTPRVAVDTVINRVRNIPGNEAFNFAALDAAFKSNDVVKALIKSIKDDTHTGTKYIYLTPPENTIDDTGSMDGTSGAKQGDSSKIVSGMAKRAAGN
jgi:hypothetical protein